jgi:hypothetical protein
MRCATDWAAYNIKLTALQTFLRFQIFLRSRRSLVRQPSALASLDSTLRRATTSITRRRLVQEQCLTPTEQNMLFWSKIAAAGS